MITAPRSRYRITQRSEPCPALQVQELRVRMCLATSLGGKWKYVITCLLQKPWDYT